MNGKTLFTVTREKHLDHLVRVVPLIALGYALQSYVLITVAPDGHSLVLALAASLVGMILCFVAYDHFHEVICFEEYLEVRWFFYHQKINYDEIQDVIVAEDVRSFTTVTLKLETEKKAFYFVDDALAFKTFIHSKKHKESDQIAA